MSGVKLDGVMTVLPTPITDSFSLFTNYGHMSWCVDLLESHARLERDCMTMALRLYGENTDPDTFSPETRETMKRWAPRVEALLAGEI